MEVETVCAATPNGGRMSENIEKAMLWAAMIGQGSCERESATILRAKQLAYAMAQWESELRRTGGVNQIVPRHPTGEEPN